MFTSSFGRGEEIKDDEIEVVTSPAPSTASASISGSSLKSFFARQKQEFKGPPPHAIDLRAGDRMNIAIADFIHSNCLPFSLANDAKLMKIIDEARNLGGSYSPPNRNKISGSLLDVLYATHWSEQMKTLLSEASIFGVTIFGDGATIKSVPLVNVLVAGMNNSLQCLTFVIAHLTWLQGARRMPSTLPKLCSRS